MRIARQRIELGASRPNKGKLRSRSNQQIHSPRDPVSVQRLDNVGMECRSFEGKIESLIPVYQSDLRTRRENPVVTHLCRSLRTIDKRSARCNVISDKNA